MFPPICGSMEKNHYHTHCILIEAQFGVFFKEKSLLYLKESSLLSVYNLQQYCSNFIGCLQRDYNLQEYKQVLFTKKIKYYSVIQTDSGWHHYLKGTIGSCSSVPRAVFDPFQILEVTTSDGHGNDFWNPARHKKNLHFRKFRYTSPREGGYCA